MTSRPPTASCSWSGAGTAGAAAVTTMPHTAHLRRTRPTVADDDPHVVEAQARERRPGPRGERRMPLHGDQLAAEHREDGRLVARPGAHLEHAIAGLRVERRGHQGDHVGLGDRLAAADGQGAIVVRGVPVDVRHEEMPRHEAHRLDDPRVPHAAPDDLRLDHHRPARPVPGPVQIGRDRMPPFYGATGGAPAVAIILDARLVCARLSAQPAPAPSRDTDKVLCERCGAEMFRMHAVWRCPACGFKTDCCGW